MKTVCVRPGAARTDPARSLRARGANTNTLTINTIELRSDEAHLIYNIYL